jgi:single-strand DNA-binding protein
MKRLIVNLLQTERRLKMASFNKVILIGNMVADPELKQTTSGTSVTSFSIGVNRRFSKEGEQAVDYINIVAWRQQAEFVTRYFKKGNPILICGQINTRSYTTSNNEKRYVTEVVADEVSFVASANQNEQKPATPPNPANFQNGNMPSAYSGVNNPRFEEIPNDESLPF